MELWSLKNRKALVVDDCVDIRAMIRDMLLNLGATEITTARNADEALSHINNINFDVILCDYNLGEGKDGQQILEEIRFRNLITASCLFIMITAENQSHMVMGAMEYYPDLYLSKPFTKPTLQTRLQKLTNEKDITANILGAIERESFKSALSQCDKAIRYHPRHRMLLLKLKADILLKLGDNSDAEMLFQDILQERELAWALLGLGKVYFSQKKYELAKQQFKQIVDLNPNYMEAYDWLAQCMEHLGEHNDAQVILQTASEKSPKALLRQRRLGEISMDLEDFSASKAAYKQAIENGKFSCFKEVEDYSNLAQSVSVVGEKKEALRVIEKLRKDFLGDSKAGFYANIVESDVHYAYGDDEKGELLIDQAIQHFDEHPETLSTSSVMLMAQVCLSQGNVSKGQELIKHIVRNNHDNQQILKNASKAFKKAGMEDAGDDLISSTCNEIYEINNKGIQLAQKGHLLESITLFDKAVKAMPENIAILMNATQCILLYLDKHPDNDSLTITARRYLDRAFNINPENIKYKALMVSYDSLKCKAHSGTK
ncbi:Chemotaxis regulator - transmits chemoreceptor signals to flagellar motor components CheY [hydrothermal vent metagenome]|uniref:Chemotaxis regulator - transmits chemoreceptor signals to flagellar motor components CheY n=1 Tax=hydrothermal vent metagenome TaxID=652676 RepID=A0A3B0Z8G5_9ZZZZ